MEWSPLTPKQMVRIILLNCFVFCFRLNQTVKKFEDEKEVHIFYVKGRVFYCFVNLISPFQIFLFSSKNSLFYLVCLKI